MALATERERWEKEVGARQLDKSASVPFPQMSDTADTA